MPPIDPSKWTITTEPAPKRRSAEVQAAYDFFYVQLATGASALIPKEEASTARNAAAQLKKESDGAIEIRFRDEPGQPTLIRATKVKGQSPEDLAALQAGIAASEAATE
jgi:hypothetical protein